MQLVDQREAARILGVQPRTLAQWRWLGDRGPRFRKIGTCVRYHVDDLAEFIAQAARTSTTDKGPGHAARRAS